MTDLQILLIGIACIFVLYAPWFALDMARKRPACAHQVLDDKSAQEIVRRARAQPGDPGQRLSEASSTIHRTSSSNVMPACIASSGTSEVSVIPG